MLNPPFQFVREMPEEIRPIATRDDDEEQDEDDEHEPKLDQDEREEENNEQEEEEQDINPRFRRSTKENALTFAHFAGYKIIILEVEA